MSSETFLSRWSKRKQEVTKAEQSESAPPAQAAPVEPEAAPAAVAPDEGTPLASEEAELSPEEIARLPSLDELTAETNLSLFLRKGVPAGLRKAALRRMWSLDPNIRDFVSEAREYAYDWNTPGGVPGSGGALPPSDEVMRMAARIVGAEPASESRQTGTAGSKPCEPATTRSGAEVPLAEHPAVPPAERRPYGTANEPAAEIVAASQPEQPGPQADAGDSQRDAEKSASGIPPARRHGGAMPL